MKQKKLTAAQARDTISPQEIEALADKVELPTDPAGWLDVRQTILELVNKFLDEQHPRLFADCHLRSYQALVDRLTDDCLCYVLDNRDRAEAGLL